MCDASHAFSFLHCVCFRSESSNRLILAEAELARVKKEARCCCSQLTLTFVRGCLQAGAAISGQHLQGDAALQARVADLENQRAAVEKAKSEAEAHLASEVSLCVCGLLMTRIVQRKERTGIEADAELLRQKVPACIRVALHSLSGQVAHRAAGSNANHFRGPCIAGPHVHLCSFHLMIHVIAVNNGGVERGAREACGG